VSCKPGLMPMCTNVTECDLTYSLQRELCRHIALLHSYCIVTAFLATMQILLNTCIDAKSPPIRLIMALTAFLMDSQGRVRYLTKTPSAGRGRDGSTHRFNSRYPDQHHGAHSAHDGRQALERSDLPRARPSHIKDLPHQGSLIASDADQQQS